LPIVGGAGAYQQGPHLCDTGCVTLVTGPGEPCSRLHPRRCCLTRKGWDAPGPPPFPHRQQPPRSWPCGALMKVVREHHETRRSHRHADDDHGPFRWSLLLYHLWHWLLRHLQLPLRLYHVLRDSFGGLGLADRSQPRSRPDSRICDSRARRGGRTGVGVPRQKG
jgi:hypothetical protein